MDKTRSHGFSGETIVIIEMRLNKELNQQSGNNTKISRDRIIQFS